MDSIDLEALDARPAPAPALPRSLRPGIYAVWDQEALSWRQATATRAGPWRIAATVVRAPAGKLSAACGLAAGRRQALRSAARRPLRGPGVHGGCRLLRGPLPREAAQQVVAVQRAAAWIERGRLELAGRVRNLATVYDEWARDLERVGPTDGRAGQAADYRDMAWRLRRLLRP